MMRNKRDRARRAAETAEQRSEWLKKRWERDHARHAAQTVSERWATSQWKSTGERGAETPEERETRRCGTLKEAMKMWWNNLQFSHKTVTQILFIHTCPCLAQERLDPMILKDLAKNTMQQESWVNACFHLTLAIILSYFTCMWILSSPCTLSKVELCTTSKQSSSRIT